MSRLNKNHTHILKQKKSYELYPNKLYHRLCFFVILRSSSMAEKETKSPRQKTTFNLEQKVAIVILILVGLVIFSLFFKFIGKAAPQIESISQIDSPSNDVYVNWDILDEREKRDVEIFLDQKEVEPLVKKIDSRF